MGKKILFRADGNEAIGLGHLYRLFALVEMLKESYDFCLLTKASSTLSVIPESYPIEIIPNEISNIDEPDWLIENFDTENHILVADGYQFDSTYQKRIKKSGYKLVYIDDMATEHLYADMVVNHSPGLEPTNFSYEPYTRFGLGTAYAILRPAFLEAPKNERKIKHVDTAFVCFGGADKCNLSEVATTVLLEISEINMVHVVLGAANNKKNLIELAEKEPRLKVYKNLGENDMVLLMQKCNFAIVPSSTILYELCAINMIILSGYFVDNQKRIYKGFLEKNAIFGLGDFTTSNVSQFREAIMNILNMSEAYSEMLLRQKQLFDSNIRDRYLKIMEDLC